MKFSMTGEEKGDLLIQVTAGLPVYIYTAWHIAKLFDDQWTPLDYLGPKIRR